MKRIKLTQEETIVLNDALRKDKHEIRFSCAMLCLVLFSEIMSIIAIDSIGTFLIILDLLLIIWHSMSIIHHDVRIRTITKEFYKFVEESRKSEETKEE